MLATPDGATDPLVLRLDNETIRGHAARDRCSAARMRLYRLLALAQRAEGLGEAALHRGHVHEELRLALEHVRLRRFGTGLELRDRTLEPSPGILSRVMKSRNFRWPQKERGFFSSP